MRIAAVGEVTEDVYLGSDESVLSRELGGISLNFARAAAFSGAEAHLFAAVGDDDSAARIRSALGATTVHAHLRTLHGASAVQRIKFASDGERIFDGFRAGVMHAYALTAEDFDGLRATDLVALPASQDTENFFYETLTWCKGHHIPAAADFSVDSPLGRANEPAEWVSPFASMLTLAFVGGRPEHEEALRSLARSTDLLIVLTLGAAGSVAFRGEESWRAPAEPCAVVDTTGCGDAFQAAFSVAYLEGQSISECLSRGARLAARVAAKRGAAP